LSTINPDGQLSGTTGQPADMIHIALYQPDIPGNCGTILRLAACLDVTVHVIEPAGFRMDDKSLRRAGMDYLEIARLTRHPSFEAFRHWIEKSGKNLVLFTTKATTPYTSKTYHRNDVLIFGRESSGVPAQVAAACHEQVLIPMKPAARSLNLAMSVAMATGEALRQLQG
jgi:tRNA (cytidine/uridine-2'-O-)-methyltransferase